MSSSGGTVVGNSFNSVTPAQVRPDGTFTASAIAPGTYELRVTVPAAIGQTWALQSAVLRGKDLLDFPLEIDSGGDLPNVVLTFSDRRSELTGTLQTPAGGPAPGYFVVIFPHDRTFWTPQSRRIKSARPGTDGRFTITDLPGGDYLIAALTDVDPDEWQNPAFLDQLVPAAIKVVITPGGRVTQDIRVIRWVGRFCLLPFAFCLLPYLPSAMNASVTTRIVCDDVPIPSIATTSKRQGWSTRPVQAR
jgi:hypothetical protein